MGLDMYLSVHRFIWNISDHADVAITKAVQALLPELGEVSDEYGSTNFKVGGIKAEIGYWRKANQIHYESGHQIHAWFVKNVQDGEDDCGEYDVEWGHIVGFAVLLFLIVLVGVLV